jgi:c-di-GMP phosphodiesterase
LRGLTEVALPFASVGVDAGLSCGLCEIEKFLFTMLMGHQPITDFNDALIGYRLLTAAEAAGVTATTTSQDIDLAANELLALLASLGPDAQAGQKCLAVTVGPQALQNPCLDALQPEACVLRWCDAFALDELSASRLAQRREQGFRLWLGEAAAQASSTLADWTDISASQQAALVPANAPGTGGRPALKVAGDAMDPAGVQRAREAGADAFVGFHFLAARVASVRKISPSYAAALRALSLAEREASVERIESALEQDPALTYRLLRFMNTAAVAGARRIEGLRDAMSMLGYRRLARWLALVLVTADVQSPRAALLARTAIVRARTMEMLAEAGRVSLPRDAAFLVGLFSLLDAVLGMPLPHLVEELDLTEEMRRALSERSGPLGQYLSLVQTCEDPTLARVSALCRSLELEPMALAAAQVGAIALSESLTGS